MAKNSNNAQTIYDIWNKGKLTSARALNWQTEIIYVDLLLNTLATEFTWGDDSVPEELQGLYHYIESTLNMYGCMVLFREPTTGKYLFLRATPQGSPTMYGTYTSYLAMGKNGRSFMVNAEDCVVWWNSLNKSTTCGLNITQTAYRMAEALRTADVRLLNHKAPIIFACTEEQKATIKAYMNGLSNNEQCLVVYDRQMEIPQPISNDVQYIQSNLLDYQNDILENFLMTQGFNVNPNNDKRERQIVDEVNSNNELVESFRNIKLIPRLRANEECKRKFGFSFDIKYALEPSKEEIKEQQQQMEVMMNANNSRNTQREDK